jgi:hypothetical protein
MKFPFFLQSFATLANLARAFLVHRVRNKVEEAKIGDRRRTRTQDREREQ